MIGYHSIAPPSHPVDTADVQTSAMAPPVDTVGQDPDLYISRGVYWSLPTRKHISPKHNFYYAVPQSNHALW